MIIFSEKKQKIPHVHVKKTDKDERRKFFRLLKVYCIGKYKDRNLTKILKGKKIHFLELIKANLPRNILSNSRRSGCIHLKHFLRLSILLNVKTSLRGIRIKFRDHNLLLNDEILDELFEIENRRKSLYEFLFEHGMIHSCTDPSTLYLINKYRVRKNEFLSKLMKKFKKLVGSYGLIAFSLCVDEDIVANWFREEYIPFWFVLFLSAFFEEKEVLEKLSIFYRKKKVDRNVVKNILSGELQQRMDTNESYEKIRNKFRKELENGITLLPFHLFTKEDQQVEEIVKKAKEKLGSTELLMVLTKTTFFDRGINPRINLKLFLKVCQIVGIGEEKLLELIENPTKTYQRFEVKGLGITSISKFVHKPELGEFEKKVLLLNCKEFRDIISFLIKKFSANRLAQILSRHPDTIYKWRNNGSNPRLSDIRKVCRLVNINFKRFLLGKTILPESRAYNQGCKRFRVPSNCLDKDILYLIGIIIADGTITRNETYIYSINEKYRISLRERINRVFNLNSINNETNVCICSTAFSYWLSLYFNIPLGEKSKTITIPADILKNSKTAIIKGLFDGDSSVDPNSRKIIYGTKSLGLALSIIWKLRGLGFKKARFVIVNSSPYLYEVVIVPSELELFKESIGFDHPLKDKRIRMLVSD